MWSYFGEASFKALLAFFPNWSGAGLQHSVSFSDGWAHTHTQMSCVSFFRSLCVAVPTESSGPGRSRALSCSSLRPPLEVAVRGVRVGAVRPGRAPRACPGVSLHPRPPPFTPAQASEMGASRTSLSLTRSGLADPQLVAGWPRSPLRFLPPFPSLAAQGARCSQQHRHLLGAW